jgi:hypothetical protein
MNSPKVVTDEERDFAWRVWQEKGRRQDQEGLDFRAKLTKYATIAVLLLAVIGWSHAADYQIFVRFAVCLGAVRIASLALSARKYAWAAAFVATAILYNPVVPLFALSGSVDLFLVIATLALVMASFLVLKPRLIPATAQN